MYLSKKKKKIEPSYHVVAFVHRIGCSPFFNGYDDGLALLTKGLRKTQDSKIRDVEAVRINIVVVDQLWMSCT
jgi:hypothetical protein